MRIQKIGVMSLAKIFGLLHAGMGLIFGAVVSAVALVGGIASQINSDAGLAGVAGFASIIMGAGAIVLLPLIYGTMGFIMGLFTALLYNVAAKFAGGLEIDLEPLPPSPEIPRPAASSPQSSVS